MADGKFSMPYSKFLGYEKGEDGRMVINEDQAKVVEQIYGLFIAGFLLWRSDRVPADLRDGDRKLKSITGTASHPCWWGAFLNKAGKILSSENPVFMVYSI